ncbi:hypothetical protein M0802_013505 [Mischocyttarus mexicanus]|nr:hypothetical protein M0802_013505 [Mischocyttarus mexicanus]
MTRLEKLITEGSLAPAEINARSDRLKALMSRYDNLHETLDEHEKDHGEFNDLDELHDAYYELIAKLSENTNIIASTSSTTTSCATPIETPRLVSLPRINIPTFDGNFEKWIPYRVGFMTLVGSRTDINELEKLDYLRESLRGLPRETVSQFSVKEGSYKLAWEDLLATHDRKRLLLAQHVDAILATQKLKLTDLKEKLITEGSLAPAEINARSDRLKALMSRYDNLHETLDEHEKDHGEFTDLDELHDAYYALIAKLSENTNIIASTSSTTTSCATPIETPRLVSLPRINIPTFDGNFEKWIPYRDGFMTLVGSRTDINELEKLDYLRESLRGLPRETVSQFSGKESSYKLAWEALLATHDRKRLLLAQHVDAILATQKPKLTDLKGMTRLINDTRA